MACKIFIELEKRHNLDQSWADQKWCEDNVIKIIIPEWENETKVGLQKVGTADWWDPFTKSNLEFKTNGKFHVDRNCYKVGLQVIGNLHEQNKTELRNGIEIDEEWMIVFKSIDFELYEKLITEKIGNSWPAPTDLYGDIRLLDKDGNNIIVLEMEKRGLCFERFRIAENFNLKEVIDYAKESPESYPSGPPEVITIRNFEEFSDKFDKRFLKHSGIKFDKRIEIKLSYLRGESFVSKEEPNFLIHEGKKFIIDKNYSLILPKAYKLGEYTEDEYRELASHADRLIDKVITIYSLIFLQYLSLPPM